MYFRAALRANRSGQRPRVRRSTTGANIPGMLGAVTLLLVYQTIGEIVVQFTGLPVPGPVIGMLLLFATLLVRGCAPASLRDTSQQLLSHLSLLFVPAGVGVMLHFERLGSEWLPITLALLASTVITIAVTALVMQRLRRLTRAEGSE